MVLELDKILQQHDIGTRNEEVRGPIGSEIPESKKRPGLYISTETDSRTSESDSDCTLSSQDSQSSLSSYASSTFTFIGSEGANHQGSPPARARKPSLLARALSLSPRGIGSQTADLGDDSMAPKRSQSAHALLNCRPDFFAPGRLAHYSSSSSSSSTGSKEINQVKFLRCKHCNSIFSGSGNQFGGESGHSNRHMFCSGECYITRYAIIHAAQMKQQQKQLHRQRAMNSRAHLAP